MSVIQFAIPRSLAAPIELDTIKQRGRLAGVPDVRFGHSTTKVATATVRITCSVTMAVFLRNRIQEFRARSTGEQLIRCDQALKAITDEIQSALFSPSIEDLERANV